MKQSQLWHTTSQGIWAALVGGLKLVVRQNGRFARFLISKPKSTDDLVCEMLLLSGTREDVGAAMIAAEAEAHRLEGRFAAMRHAA